MEDKFQLPDDELAGQQITEAWDSFVKQLEQDAGVRFDDNDAVEFAKTIFVSGYCYGHNDCLDSIRGQADVIEGFNNALNNQNK